MSLPLAHSPIQSWPWRKRLKNSLVYYPAISMLRLASLWPFWLSRCLAPILGLLAWGVARKERRRAMHNLSRSDLGLSGAEARRVCRQVFVELGYRAVEWLMLARARGRRRLRSRVYFAPGGRRLLEQTLGHGRGVVVVAAHQGNWELLAAALSDCGPISVLGRPSYDPRFTRWIDRVRRASGVSTLWVDDPAHLRTASKRLAEGEQLGVLLDQPAGEEGGTFLGRPVKVSQTAVGLARLSGAAVLLASIVREGQMHRIVLQELPVERGGSRLTALTKGTAQATAWLEHRVRLYPAQWLWTLDRWR